MAPILGPPPGCIETHRDERRGSRPAAVRRGPGWTTSTGSPESLPTQSLRRRPTHPKVEACRERARAAGYENARHARGDGRLRQPGPLLTAAGPGTAALSRRARDTSSDAVQELGAICLRWLRFREGASSYVSVETMSTNRRSSWRFAIVRSARLWHRCQAPLNALNSPWHRSRAVESDAMPAKPVRRIGRSTRLTTWRTGRRRPRSASPARFPSPAASSRRCIAAACGRCGSTRGSGRPPSPTAGTDICCRRASAA